MIRPFALPSVLLAVVTAPAQEPAPAPDPPLRTVLTYGGTHRSIPAPGEGTPHGLAVLNGALWLARGNGLYKLNRTTGAVLQRFDLPSGTRDLAADGRFLYAVSDAWNTGSPIRVIDPLVGRVVRKIALPTDAQSNCAPAVGLAWHEGALFVLDQQRAIHEVNPVTGTVARSWQPRIRNAPVGLTSDGKKLIATSRYFLTAIDLDPEQRVNLIRIFVPPGSLAFGDGAFYLIKADREPGGHLYEFRLGEADALLELGVVCRKRGEQIPDPDHPGRFRLEGHEAYFELGPKTLTRESLRKELERLSRLPELRGRDAKGNDCLGGVLVTVGLGTTWADIGVALDALRATGFRDITLGGELPPK